MINIHLRLQALEHYTEINDIKRVIIHTGAMNAEVSSTSNCLIVYTRYIHNK
jgi:hypothetical protein